MDDINYSETERFITAREAARLLGIGLSTFYREVAALRLPKPCYITPGSPRWQRRELVSTALARCQTYPPRSDGPI